MLIETINQMQSSGLSDTEIIQKLQEQGYNPKDIEDSLSQTKIKAAVSDYEQSGQESIMSNQEMQPSITQTEMPAAQEQQYSYAPEQSYQGYGSQEYYQPQSQSQGISPETIMEIAEQVVSEKLASVTKTLSNLADFKTVTEAKIQNMDSRLKRIETTIEKLQDSIIGRVGEYGQALSDIKDEMGMMQESFSKVVNQAVSGKHKSKDEEVKHPAHKPESSHQQAQERKPHKKSKDGFENYLR